MNKAIRYYSPVLIIALLLSTVCSSQHKFIETSKGNKIPVKELDNFISTQMNVLKIPGLSMAIINNGAIVHAKNYGVKNRETNEKVTEHTLFEAASLSKPVFAYFVLKQVMKGVLQLDQPLYTYYQDPEIDTTASLYKLLTARMVLNQCSGFPNWRNNSRDKLNFLFPPGTKYGYSGEGYLCLKRVLTQLLQKTDRELNDLFQEEVAGPLGIDHMSFTWDTSFTELKAFSHEKGEPTDNGPEGSPDIFGAAGTLHTTANDYAKFLLALMNIPGELTNKTLALQADLPPEEGGLARSLAFPYKLVDNKIRYFHSGKNPGARAYCHFYQTERIGIVMLSNGDNFYSSGFAANLLKFLEEDFHY